MKRILFVFLFLCLGLKYSYCEDNLLAVDLQKTKEKPADIVQQADTALKETPKEEAQPVLKEEAVEGDFDQDLKKIKAFRELINSKQKELELMKLDYEKSALLLKKKEAEKKIYEIDKTLPQEKNLELSVTSSLNRQVKPLAVEASEIKILLLVLSNDLKEGMLTLKGVPYRFKQGETIAEKLRVEKIDAAGVSFRQPDNTLLKVNFLN